MTTLPLYIVTADAQTGMWNARPEATGKHVDADVWANKVDTPNVHFDTYEADGETRAIKVVWERA